MIRNMEAWLIWQNYIFVEFTKYVSYKALQRCTMTTVTTVQVNITFVQIRVSDFEILSICSSFRANPNFATVHHKSDSNYVSGKKL